MGLAIRSCRKRAVRSSDVASRGATRVRVAACEVLESRMLMTAVVVNSILDQLDSSTSSIVTLRDAIARANASTTATTITFNPTVFSAAQTIKLNGTPLAINAISKSDSVTITGPTAGLVIYGNNASGVFTISSTSNASLNYLTIAGGKSTDGGGINNAGTLILQHSTLYRDAATDGGGLYNTGVAYLIDDTAFLNTATVGGGVWNGGNLTLANSTIANNTATYGGGIFNSGSPVGSARLINVTVSGNTASAGGGVFNATGGTVTLANTIVAGNIRTGTALSLTDVDGIFTSSGFNLIGNVDGGSGFVSSDLVGHSASPLNAKLNPLGNYGGPTQTTTLQTGSPALAAGSTALDTFTTDQRGLPRIVSGKIDIGAIETQAPVLPVPIVTGPGSTTSPGPVLTTFTPKFTWKAITTGITGYLLTLHDVTTNKTYTYTISPTATSFVLPAGVLLPANQYVWNLRVLNGTASGAPSTYLYFQSPPALPVPSVISPGSTTAPGPKVTTLTPTFQWHAVSGITGYQLNLYDITTGKFVSYVISPTATSFTVPTALTSGNAFVWNLRVLDGTVTGTESAYLYFQT